MTCTSIPASPAPCSTREIRDPLLQRDHRERSEAPITSWVIGWPWRTRSEPGERLDRPT